MSRSSGLSGLGVALLSTIMCVPAGAQPAASEDAIVRPIQRMSTIGKGDQRRIGDWVRGRVKELKDGVREDGPAAFRGFRERVGALYKDRGNTQAFKTSLAAQVTRIAIEEFAGESLASTAAWALARVLVDMDTPEAYSGFIAGLKSKFQPTRFLCAKGLARLQRYIVQDKDRLDETVAALREAGEAEPGAVVLGRIYLALAYPDQVNAVFDAYLSLFDKRLARRRGSAVFVDRAEVDAFDYFRRPGVVGSLSAEQKSSLVKRLAVFLRLDAQRYSASDVAFDEEVSLERRLAGVEALLEAIVGKGKGGDIRGELRAGGRERREAVLQQAYRWIGHPTTQKPGALNAAPWNVEIAAP